MPAADNTVWGERFQMTSPAIRAIVLSGIVLLLGSTLAEAQRVFLSVNGGSQLGAPNFRHEVTYSFRSPPDTLNIKVGSEYPIEDGGMLDVGGGVYVRPNIAVGTALTRTSQTTQASLFLETGPSGQNVDTLRFTGTTSIDRTEAAVHVYGIYFLAITDRLTVAFFGGPSYLAVTQHVVESIDLLETLTLSPNGTRKLRDSAWGANAGVDISYFFTDVLGVGLNGRFTRATVNFENLIGTTFTNTPVRVDSEAGGAQVSAGLRLRFRAKWWNWWM